MTAGGVPEVLDDIMALDTELFLWCVACVCICVDVLERNKESECVCVRV